MGADVPGSAQPSPDPDGTMAEAGMLRMLPGCSRPASGSNPQRKVIRSFEVQFMPGRFQTGDYARAVTRARAPQRDREGERPQGCPALLRVQPRRPVEVAELPPVRLQVVPFSPGGHAGANKAFSALRFREQDLPDVVWIEQIAGEL